MSDSKYRNFNSAL